MFENSGSPTDRHDGHGAVGLADGVLDLLETGVVAARDGIVMAANPAAARLLSVPVEELSGRPVAPWGSCCDNGRNEGETVAPGAPSRRLRVRRKRVDAKGGGAIVFLIDAAEPSSSEARARLLTVEGTLGELRTISHNINNPMTALLGRAQILRATAAGDPRVEKASIVIEESASRIAELARELSRTLRRCCEEAEGSTPETAEPAGRARG